MADYNDEKTVIVDRDTADRSSPIGWIIIVVLLLIVALFFVMNYIGDGTADTTDTDDSSLQESTSPADTVVPGVDSGTDTDTTTNPEP